ncbi:DUF4240 domain-containing protein [Paractinoplanes durhamensis]|uniref:Transposase n=1 Tax=Paractinoplanes durhamensis TaxID=113563 RepID=A0ABQ3YWW3_9ACTN|nr:DUF4240 domain-containing protein [Actinoplanes durhamensis]GIE02053.1 hypothetical protein Adu01nite_34030 [Actinoplanes durhamensis]
MAGYRRGLPAARPGRGGGELCHVQDWIISYGRTTVERIARDPDSLADLAGDAGNARAGWFDEFTTEAHIIVSGTWPYGRLAGILTGRRICSVGAWISAIRALSVDGSRVWPRSGMPILNWAAPELR